MTHVELVNWIMGAHATVLLATITFYFKTVDYKLHKTSFDAGKETKYNLKKIITVELSETLKPIFSKPNDEVIRSLEIFGPDGLAWNEGYPKTIETENYNNALHKYVKQNFGALADLCTLIKLIEKCTYWSGLLNKLLLSLILFQVIALALTVVVEKLFDYHCDDLAIISTIIITVLLVLACVMILPFLNNYHEKLDGYAIKYD